jgi:hypothetical protein
VLLVPFLHIPLLHIPSGSVQKETAAPEARNSILFLQACVNWPEGGQLLVTTSRAKDTRGYDYNERATIAAGAGAVQCVAIGGRRFGRVALAAPLKHYHHAGRREYQSEVALLTRNIKIQGTAGGGGH